MSAELDSGESLINCDEIAGYTPDTFESLVGDGFTFSDGTKVTLVSLTVHANLGDAEYRQRVPFSLLFKAPRSVSLATGIRQVRHSSGTFTMAMNPVQVPRSPSDQDDSIHFESVFA